MKIFKLFIGIFIGILLCYITVHALTYNSSDVVYENSASGLSSTTVQGALQELYSKAAGNRGYTVNLSGSNVNFSSSSVKVPKGNFTVVTVTPAVGYSLDSASCTNQYHVYGIHSKNPGSQNVAICNNTITNTTGGTCTFTAKTASYDVTISYTSNRYTIFSTNNCPTSSSSSGYYDGLCCQNSSSIKYNGTTTVSCYVPSMNSISLNNTTCTCTNGYTMVQTTNSNNGYGQTAAFTGTISNNGNAGDSSCTCNLGNGY